MKHLQRGDIDKVRPKFRPMVRDAWNNGEQVPYSIIHLSDEPLTKSDIDCAKKLAKKYKWKIGWQV